MWDAVGALPKPMNQIKSTNIAQGSTLRLANLSWDTQKISTLANLNAKGVIRLGTGTSVMCIFPFHVLIYKHPLKTKRTNLFRRPLGTLDNSLQVELLLQGLAMAESHQVNKGENTSPGGRILNTDGFIRLLRTKQKAAQKYNFTVLQQDQKTKKKTDNNA